MTKEQKKALARVLRQLVKRGFADVPALTSLLDTYAGERKRVPKNWRKHLVAIQASADYRKILEEFEPTISRLETSPVDDELIELFEKISRGKLPN
jgi:hypothetical protein